MQEYGKCTMQLVNKEPPERPRNQSLVTFHTIQFSKQGFRVKLAFGKSGRIFLILEVADHRRHLFYAKHLF